MAKKPKQSIEEMVHDRYEDADTASGVLDHIAEIGTADKIVRGELTLPDETDARRFVAEYRKSKEPK